MRLSTLTRMLPSALCMFMAGCSVLDTVNALGSSSGSTRQAGIDYGDHPRHGLDLYAPNEPVPNAAIVVFFYGGAWTDGDRADYEFVARRLARAGHYVVVPDYRLYPEVTFPQFVYDGASAVAYVLSNRVDLAGGPRPVFVMGHSAGAHIAMLLGLDSRYLGRAGRRPEELAGVIGLAGPYDFLPLESLTMRNIFPADKRRDSQPINFAQDTNLPVLLIHGDGDQRVWLRNSVNLAEALSSQGAEVELRVYPGVDHTGVISPFVSFVKDKHGVMRDVLLFLGRYSADADG